MSRRLLAAVMGLLLVTAPTLPSAAAAMREAVSGVARFKVPTLPVGAVAGEAVESLDLNGTRMQYQRFDTPLSEAATAAHFVRQWGRPARVERLGSVLRYLWVLNEGTALLQFEAPEHLRGPGTTAWWSWRPWPAPATAVVNTAVNEAESGDWAPTGSEWLLRYRSRQGAQHEHVLMFRNRHGAAYNLQHVRQRCLARGLRDIRSEAAGAVLHCAGVDETLTATGQDAIVLRWRTAA